MKLKAGDSAALLERKHLSKSALIKTLKALFGKVTDKISSRNMLIELADALMAAFAPADEASKIKGTKKGGVQRAVFELKILYGTKKKTLTEGLEQTKMYLDQVGHHEGRLLIFNRNKKVPWSKKIYRETHRTKIHKITVWGM